MLRAGSINSSLNTRQTVLNNGTLVPKIKRNASNVVKDTASQSTKAVNNENEVPANKQVPALNSRSKKISKAKDNGVTTRRVFGEITNQLPTIEEESGKLRKSLSLKVKEFAEDDIPKTSNYFNLNYINRHNSKTYSFPCFQDKDLKIPSNYAEKTITHSCDNDCTTDEDQIRSAIRNLYRSIEGQVKEMKEAASKAI